MLGGLRPLGGACARDGIPNTSTSGSGSAPLCCELTTTAGAKLFGSCETMTDRKAFPAATARRAVSHLLASLGMPILNVGVLAGFAGAVLAMLLSKKKSETNPNPNANRNPNKQQSKA